jgi:hypothetical protein
MSQQRGSADRRICGAHPFGTAHRNHVHLPRNVAFGAEKPQNATPAVCATRYRLPRWSPDTSSHRLSAVLCDHVKVLVTSGEARPAEVTPHPASYVGHLLPWGAGREPERGLPPRFWRRPSPPEGARGGIHVTPPLEQRRTIPAPTWAAGSSWHTRYPPMHFIFARKQHA